MNRRSMLLCIGLLWTTVSGFTLGAKADTPRFESDVRPILKAHCWQCHGEVDELKGGLDTRLARLLLKGGESGAAIVAGKHAESLLYQRVASGEMPPGSKMLSEQEISMLAEWIDSGAKTLRPEPESLPREGSFTEEERGHWSFQPVRRPPLPSVTKREDPLAAACEERVVEMQSGRPTDTARTQPQVVLRQRRFAEDHLHHSSDARAVADLPQRRSFANRSPERDQIVHKFTPPALAGHDSFDGRRLDLTDFDQPRKHLVACGQHFVCVKRTAQKDLAAVGQTPPQFACVVDGRAVLKLPDAVVGDSVTFE